MPLLRFRARFPQLTPELGFYPTGPYNSITDVPGVEVGHATLNESPYFTGVTAVIPRKDVFSYRPWASGHVLHGAGECTGFQQILEWGVIETPILLTSSLNVGRVLDGFTQYLLKKHPTVGRETEVLLPVVAECDDSFVNESRDTPIDAAMVAQALDLATSGPVAEGSVGAGTGMAAFDFKAGIGTASRVITLGDQRFHLGTLVNANVGRLRHLRILGRPVGRWAELEWAERNAALPSRPAGQERSIIVVIATDAPLRPDQLRRLSTRASLALGRLGSFASHASGEIILSFTTTGGEHRQARGPLREQSLLNDTHLDPFYEAVIEATEESVLNALSMATPIKKGRKGHALHTVPWNEVAERFFWSNLSEQGDSS